MYLLVISAHLCISIVTCSPFIQYSLQTTELIHPSCSFNPLFHLIPFILSLSVSVHFFFSPMYNSSSRFFRSSLRETLSMVCPCWHCQIWQVCPHIPAHPPLSTVSTWRHPLLTWSALQDLAAMPALQGFLFRLLEPGASTGTKERGVRAPRGQPSM